MRRRAQAAKGESAQTMTPQPDPAELREGFGEYLSLELGRSKDTVRAYFDGIRRIEMFTGGLAEDASATDIRRFLRETTYAAQSKRCTVAAVRSFHQWGALEEFWPLNAIMALKTPRVVQNPLPPLSVRDAKILLCACEISTDYRLVYSGLYAGTRVSEAAAMAEAMWGEDRLHFVGKGRKSRTVPAHSQLQQVREEVLRSGPCSPFTLQSARTRLTERTGIKFTTHTLRRTFAATMYEVAPREIVGALLGHVDSVTGLYAPVTYGRMAGVIEALTYEPR